MAAHAALPSRRRPKTHGRHLRTRGWGLPVTLGLAYGIYAAAIQRSGGVITWGQVLLGLVSGVVLAGAVYALRQRGRALPRELRATAWAVLVGGAIGFLYSVSDASVLSATVLGLVIAAGTFLTAFYLFYTHEDATGTEPAPTTGAARPHTTGTEGAAARRR
ncbi:hypothetical protein ABZX98_18085 [Streptomyces sp. NPDC002992]|uniref:hypothetical protein n=1 Tax=Streptomyces sp. NPDC002992 TaxID=3154273 RepID=UPI0033A0C62C